MPGNVQQPPATQSSGGTSAAIGSSMPQGGSGGGSSQMNPTPPVEPPAGGASEGCGVSSGIPANPAVPNTILTFPPTYDGRTPLPLVFAFHGAGRTNTDMRNVDSRTNGSELEDNYIVAYMKSAGNGWDIGADYPRFEAALDQILAQMCIDTRSLFAFGHSSGAQFIVQMLGDNRTRETRLAGVVPVASSRYNNPSWTPLPTLVIHGVNDNQRNGDRDGASDIVQYTQSNQCSGGTQPLTVPACASIANGVAVNAGCVEYSGCAAPTIFCNHDDPNYIDNGTPTNHGWPCFANDQIFQFFESLRP